jgi:tetratricopeptide (TPR) repeat protein
MNKVRAILAASFLLLASSLHSRAAQQEATDDKAAVAEASAAYNAKDWTKAARLYEPMVKAHPEIPRLWFRLATSQQELGKLDQAVQIMEQGLKAGVPPIFAEFALGTIYAQKGVKERAFQHLQKALDNGYNKPEQFDTDEHR